MFRLASLSLFTAYIFLLRFISIAQIGPDWELPYQIYKESKIMLMFGVLFVVVSCVLTFKAYVSFIRSRTYSKAIYTFLLVIILGVVVLGVTRFFYSLRVCSPMLSSRLRYVFWPGLLTLIALQILLQSGIKGDR